MFWKLIVQAAKSINENRGVLAKALLIPLLIYLGLYLIMLVMPESWISFLSGILIWGVYAIFAVTTHRVVLLGPDALFEWGRLKWTKRETIFVLYQLGLGVIGFAIVGLGGFALLTIFGNRIGILGFMAFIILGITFTYVIGRLSLVLPSIAIDKSIGFKGSWKLTKGFEEEMMLIVFIFPILLGIPMLLVSVALFIPIIRDFPSYLDLLSLFLNMLFLPVTVFIFAALSVTYRFIMDEKDNPQDKLLKHSP